MKSADTAAILASPESGASGLLLLSELRQVGFMPLIGNLQAIQLI